MAITLTWLGQSGLLLQGDGRNVLVDPWLSPHEARAVPAPELAAWPERIDIVLITHGHGDHLDLPGLKGLMNKTAIGEIVAPEPHLAAIAEALPEVSRIGMKPGQRLDRLGGIAAVRAWHGVTMDDGYGPMVGPDGASPQVGFVFTMDGAKIYISGDTLADPELADEVRPLRPDVAFLPVNGRGRAREARGILGNMDAVEAVALALDLGAGTLVPLHHDGVTGNTSDIGEVARAAQGKPLHVIAPARTIPFAFDGRPK